MVPLLLLDSWVHVTVLFFEMLYQMHILQWSIAFVLQEELKDNEAVGISFNISSCSQTMKHFASLSLSNK